MFPTQISFPGGRFSRVVAVQEASPVMLAAMVGITPSDHRTWGKNVRMKR